MTTPDNNHNLDQELDRMVDVLNIPYGEARLRLGMEEASLTENNTTELKIGRLTLSDRAMTADGAEDIKRLLEDEGPIDPGFIK